MKPHTEFTLLTDYGSGGPGLPESIIEEVRDVPGVAVAEGGVPVLKEQDTVRVTGSDRVMRDHEDGLTEVVYDPLHELEHLRAGTGIEVARRFIGKDV